jgi:hypothetical protein
MREGHAHRLQDRGEMLRPARELGETVLQEAETDDQPQEREAAIPPGA